MKQLNGIYDKGEDDEDARIELALPKHGVDISNIGKNRFLFQFYHWRDKQRVLDEQPWHFDRHALILGETTDSVKPSDIELFHLPMWIRVYNLPFKGRLNLANIENIGNKIGMFVKLDAAAKVGIDKSIRIRVLVDVRKPLFKQARLKLRGGIEEAFEVKYEKPPLFCFFCGMMGHGVKDCEKHKDLDEPVLPYGSWLKASPWKYISGERVDLEGKDSQCAKTLFVTKPKQRGTSTNVETSQVVEVLDKLGEVALNSMEGIQKAFKKKNWKRHVRDGDRNMEGEVILTGEKMKISDDLGEIEESNKSRALVQDSSSVAGPTQRALGDQ
ncbi:uncharacterized protein LOC110708126 [Chenopodium quinoa]|uniref:uncharacterized protein LOC110708126 n=1 Tax=Chenopodium quinoa TaxID=63459 RepID=UPI000B799674|nr:uncharacterized protein LOC110708126 [Chenopodium quinoa]